MPQELQNCDETCRRLKWVFRLLVLAQFILVGTIVTLLRSAFTVWPTALLSLSGLLLGGWSLLAMGKSLSVSPQLKNNAQLKTSGPYQIVRNPMYLALLIFCGGYVLADGQWMGWAYWFSLAAILSIKIYYEEKILRASFPAYSDYAKKTKCLIPLLY